jgi:uncharacterized protein
MKISELYVYPIKSLGAVSRESCEVQTQGFKYDREWMLTDLSGNFLSQRKTPQMSFVKVSILEDSLSVYHKNFPAQKLKIPFEVKSKQKQTVSIWDDQMPALLVDPIIDEWFTDMLGLKCRLVKLDRENKRMLKSKYQVNGEHVSFADSMPYLLIGRASLDELNLRLEQKIPMLRFRPNIVFTGGGPFEEDDWKQINIAKVKFKITKPCARCVVTTIHLETGKKGKEPLHTLSLYRQQNGKVLFGQNMIALEKGTVHIGDCIEIT